MVGVRRSGRTKDESRFHCVRPRRGRGLPDPDGTADDCSLGGEDPAEGACDGIARKAVFSKVLCELHNRISIFVNLPLYSLDRWKLQQELDYIWRTPHGEAEEVTN